MNQLKKNRFANIIIWLAFFAFGMHSLSLGHFHKDHFDFCTSCIQSVGIHSNDQQLFSVFTTVLDKFSPIETHENSCSLFFNSPNQTDVLSFTESIVSISFIKTSEPKRLISTMRSVWFRNHQTIFLIFSILLI